MAYSTHAAVQAHQAVVEGFGEALDPSNSVLLFDGGQALVKEQTHTERDRSRSVSLKKAKDYIRTFQGRCDQDYSIQKKYHLDTKRHPNRGFEWRNRQKGAVAANLEAKGRSVDICSLEADLEMAGEYMKGDVCLTRDRGALEYEGIQTIWWMIPR
ncbi:hypothetical protein BX616_002578, partial [Lobosporangium transversale]